MKILVLMIVLVVATSAQAAQHKHLSTQQRLIGDGCPAAFFRGVGGHCILNPDYPRPYRHDPNWTPCDYSLGPQYPEGCGS
jgi:hypothetical protein